MEINKDLNYLTGIVLKKISSRKDGFYHELYPYFELEDGTHIEDIGVSPKRIAENLVNYGLAHSLVYEKCELTELGVKIGQGIGFETYINELNKTAKEKLTKESKRQDKEDKLLDFNLKITEFEAKQGKKIKKWAFAITILNLIIAFGSHFIPTQNNELKDAQETDQTERIEKKIKQLESQILKLEQKSDSTYQLPTK